MSKKPSQNAPVVTDTKPIESHGVTDEVPVVRDDSVSKPNEPFQLIPPFQISGKAKTMAKSVGIDLSSVEAMAPRMNEWASSVEQRLNVIINAIPQLPLETIKLLHAEAEKQIMQKSQTSQTSQPTSMQGGKLEQIIDQYGPVVAEIIKAVEGSGGSNPLQEKMNTFMGAMMDKGINDILHPAPSIAERVGEEVLLKFAAKRAAEAAELITK